MSISASEARKTLFPLIERVNADRDAVEIVSRKGNAVLMPADEYAAWPALPSTPAMPMQRLIKFSRLSTGRAIISPKYCLLFQIASRP